jgi:[acyl-carrier-protein] S-malonyltransferase
MSRNPNSKYLFIFPGQGSQYPGIGYDLYEKFSRVQEIYDQASQVLGFDIAELSFHDPRAEINLTRFTQPVLLTHSIACLEAFREVTGQRIVANCTAGHSLGEYTALVAAGALSFDAAVGLVGKRGELMGAYGDGEMAAFPLDIDTVRPVAEAHYCAVAACNLPEQTVLGGRSYDLDRVTEELATDHPRRRATRLKTEGAFHTYYMVEAASRFRESLTSVALDPPQIEVLSNFSGGIHDPDPERIKSKLFFQLFHPVLWHANLLTAAEQNPTTIIEFGGGIGSSDTPDAKRPNLEGIVRKTYRGHRSPPAYHAVINERSLEQTAQVILE